MYWVLIPTSFQIIPRLPGAPTKRPSCQGPSLVAPKLPSILLQKSHRYDGYDDQNWGPGWSMLDLFNMETFKFGIGTSCNMIVIANAQVLGLLQQTKTSLEGQLAKILTPCFNNFPELIHSRHFDRIWHEISAKWTRQVPLRLGQWCDLWCQLQDCRNHVMIQITLN